MEIKINQPTLSDLKKENNEKELLRLARSANIIINQPAFDRILNEIYREIIIDITKPTTTDEEANILRRLINKLGVFQDRMIACAEESYQIQQDKLPAGKKIK